MRQTEALTSRKSDSSPPADRSRRTIDPETAALERDLTERLGLKVEISFDGKGGTLRIRYQSLDQLDGLVTLLSRD